MKRAFSIIWQTAAIGILCGAMIVTTSCSVDQVLSTIDVALQTAASLSTAIGAVSPADAAALTLLTGLGSRGIEAIKTAYDDYEKNKTSSNLQNIVAAGNAIKDNLPQELSALHISDPNAVQKATAWVNLLTTSATDIVGMVVGTASGNAKVRVISVNPDAMKARWLNEVCNGDTHCGDLVKVHRKKLLGVF